MLQLRLYFCKLQIKFEPQLNMQNIIGFIILGIIILLSGGISYHFGNQKYQLDDLEEKWFKQSFFTLAWTAAGVVLSYVCIGMIGLILWIIALIGIWLREILQWLIESLAAPFKLFLDLLF